MSEVDSLAKDLAHISLTEPLHEKDETGGSRSDAPKNKTAAPVLVATPSSSTSPISSSVPGGVNGGFEFVDYLDESQLSAVMSLVGRDLSEPYSIFTYRYFLYRFPNLCILAVDQETKEPIGCVVAKVDYDSNTNNAPAVAPIVQGGESSDDASTMNAAHNTDTTMTGYIGMLAVSQPYRRKGIGKALVQKVIERMKDLGCSSVTLETEVTNLTAQRLYQDIFGFVREELLVRYYLNWNDAYRLRLWF